MPWGNRLIYGIRVTFMNTLQKNTDLPSYRVTRARS